MLKLNKNQKDKIKSSSKVTVKRIIVNHKYKNAVFVDGKKVSVSKWNAKNKKADVIKIIQEFKKDENKLAKNEFFNLALLWERTGKKKKKGELSKAFAEIRLISRTNFNDLNDEESETLLKKFVKTKLTKTSWSWYQDFENKFRLIATKTINRGTSIDATSGISLIIDWGNENEYTDSHEFAI